MSTATRPPNVVVFMGSARPREKMGPFPGRVCDRVVQFIKNKLEPKVNVVVVDPSHPEYQLDMLAMPYHWAKALKKPISANLQRLVDVVANADGYVFVTPEYNFTIAPALVNLIDHLPPLAYGGKMGLKPSLLVSYSMNKGGGMRALAQMRSLAAEIGTVTCSSTFSVSEAHITLTEAGEEIIVDEKAGPVWTNLFKKCSTEFLFVLHALQNARHAAKL